MPRVGGSRKSVGAGTTPFRQPSPVKIPLNDDVQEKAKRMQSRQALQEAQINQLKAAATPRKSLRREDFENATPASASAARTPGARAPRTLTDGDDDDIVIGGSAVTPMKRVPILANFEEWMRMATDNKINANNSWNFALIDYFHDMSLLKEGDGVNFQKASCTLDGCVKIYTSRVDSVATETGKLLSGLADSNSNKKKRGADEDGVEGGEGGDESDEEVGEDGQVRKKSKKKSRSSEATLAPSFSSLQLKKFELEFSVDPLFKKASADFDEGGAKGLLLNHLMIDAQGRIVFDSSDDAGDTSDKNNDGTGDDADDAEELDNSAIDATKQLEEEAGQSALIDVQALGAKFFPDLDRIDELHVCPSLRNFELGDPSGSMDIPFLKAPEDWKQDGDRDGFGGNDKSGIFIDDDQPGGFDDDDLGLGTFDVGGDVAFGEGGEAWAREAALEPQMRVYVDAGPAQDGVGGDGVEMLDEETGEYTVTMNHARSADKMHEDILGYFDQALQKNWTSAEHWRIRKIKDLDKPAAPARQRKEKEPFEIDFSAPMSNTLAEALYTRAANNTAISMPKKDWTSKSRNLLPDDKHFSSKQLLNLFLKPKARLNRRRALNSRGPTFGNAHLHQNQDEPEVREGDMDEAFWAQQKAPANGASNDDDHADAMVQGDYDANFFQDDGLPFPGGMGDDDDDDDLVFADAREHFSPGADDADASGAAGMALTGETLMANTMGAFGTQLVTQSRRVRPEYVQYARVAKKVDVRRLKEELWTGMGFESLFENAPSAPASDPDAMDLDDDAPPPPPPQQQPPPGAPNPTLKFTTVMNNLQTVYPKSVMDDISTSYCFICLLHLANEKGLVISKTPDLMELQIQRDWTAEITAE
jgi:condensin complex subunit 2